MVRRAIYAGSFDPIQYGHLDIIDRASKIFDELTVLIAVNDKKPGDLTHIRRKRLIEEYGLPENVRVDLWPGLVVDYAELAEANYLVRGIRDVSDAASEIQMANFNKDLTGIDTILIPSLPEYSFLSSSAVRTLVGKRAFSALTKYIPPNVIAFYKGR